MYADATQMHPSGKERYALFNFCCVTEYFAISKVHAQARSDSPIVL